MRVLSLFSGIGAFEKALENGGHDYELVNYCEIDPYASKAYAQIHGVSEDLNLKDVTKINTAELKDIDLITYGFPCQDISVAGRQKGFTDETGKRTRSGLFFEALRVIQDTKPRYAIAENVRALTSKKFKSEFATVLSSLELAGYVNYWAVLNAKDYGVPQNRERVFIVSIRKDIDLKAFKFPEKQPLDLRLKDMLEDSVDPKYYLNSDRAKSLIAQIQERYTIQEPEGTAVIEPEIKTAGNMNGHQSGQVIDPAGLVGTIHACYSKEPIKIIEPKLEIVGHMGVGGERGRVFNPEGIAACLSATEAKPGDSVNLAYPGSATRRGRVYDPDGLAPTLSTMQGGGLEPKIIEPVIAASCGRNPDNPGDRTAGIKTEQRLEINAEGVSNTLTTVQKDNYVLEPQVLRYERTEYGKAIRNQYEKGEINERRCNMRKFSPRQDGISNTLATVQKDNYVLEPTINKAGNLDGHETGEVLNAGGIAKTLKATDWKNPVKIVEPCLHIKEATKQGYAEAKPGDSVNLAYPGSATRRGRVDGEISNTLTTGEQIGVVTPELRIRKLTPRECWRLMGFSDEDFNRVQGISNTQLYKMAGNSIVVQVLEAIFDSLLNDQERLARAME